MPQKKYCIILIFVLVLCVALSGCGMVGKLQDWKNGEVADVISDNPLDPGQLILDRPIDVPGDPQPQNPVNPVRMVQLSLYFAAPDGMSLQKETRLIPMVEGIARATVNELIRGPQEGNLRAALPVGTVLKDINIKDGVCILDFNSVFKNGLTTAEEETLAVFSIVNSLSHFGSINEVKILVEGKEISRLAGAINVMLPIPPNFDIVTN
ncbi:MAG: GerMN domain-containing protein [Clostridiales bacterium]|nr:GerMN domain-containing protein [Clostridiales bacterium]